MKLLLTSAGFENQAIINALRKLLGKECKDANLVFISTAANMEPGDKGWLIKDFVACQQLGFKQLDIIDIASVPQEVWKPRLEVADVIMVGGGNTSYLMAQIKKSGLADALPEFLKTRLYVGVSAGSMVMAPSLQEQEMQRLYEEEITNDDTSQGLGVVDFLVVPHLNSEYFPHVAELIDEVAKGIAMPLYVIDDKTAVQVVDGKVDVVSEGEWRRYN